MNHVFIQPESPRPSVVLGMCTRCPDMGPGFAVAVRAGSCSSAARQENSATLQRPFKRAGR